MRLSLRWVLLGSVVCSSAMATQATLPVTPLDRQLISETARARAQADLGKPIRLTSVHIGQDGAWALVHAHMQTPEGAEIDYAGTAYADAAARGHKSASYVALLRKEQGHWSIVADSVGPTDESWQNWRRQYRAPDIIFSATN